MVAGHAVAALVIIAVGAVSAYTSITPDHDRSDTPWLNSEIPWSGDVHDRGKAFEQGK